LQPNTGEAEGEEKMARILDDNELREWGNRLTAPCADKTAWLKLSIGQVLEMMTDSASTNDDPGSYRPTYGDAKRMRELMIAE
jgi:hypothetical protein